MFVRKCNRRLQTSGLFAKQLLYWRKEENCTGQDGVFTDKTDKLFARLSRVVCLAKVSFAIIICATQYFFVFTGTGVPNLLEIMSSDGPYSVTQHIFSDTIVLCDYLFNTM